MPELTKASYIHGPTASLLVVGEKQVEDEVLHLCIVIIWETREVREQYCRLEGGAWRGGKPLWATRAKRRLERYANDEGKLIPHLLVS